MLIVLRRAAIKKEENLPLLYGAGEGKLPFPRTETWQASSLRSGGEPPPRPIAQPSRRPCDERPRIYAFPCFWGNKSVFCEYYESIALSTLLKKNNGREFISSAWCWRRESSVHAVAVSVVKRSAYTPCLRCFCETSFRTVPLQYTQGGVA